MPATSGTAEISFSSLRRLKVCLRASMTQEGLNMALHIQQRHTDELDLRSTLANEFIPLNEKALRGDANTANWLL